MFTAACALAAITGTTHEPLTPLDLAAVLIWLLGFAIEVVADRQKQAFRRTAGATDFIRTGLWSRSRHPNYFGEIILWIGIALLALPASMAGPRGWIWVALSLVAWSGLIELVQPFVNRYGEWADLAANAMGLLLGAGAGLATRGARQQSRTPRRHQRDFGHRQHAVEQDQTEQDQNVQTSFFSWLICGRSRRC